MPSVAEELWLNFYWDTKEHVATLYRLLEDATDRYVVGGLSHGINICKYRVLKMYCDELLEDEHLLFIKHIESIAPDAIIEVPINCRRHIGCSCQKKRDDAVYEAALKRLTSSSSNTEKVNPIVNATTVCSPDSFRDNEPQLPPVECRSSEIMDHDGVISEDTAPKLDENAPAEPKMVVVDMKNDSTEDHTGSRLEKAMDKDLQRFNVAGRSRDWHSLIERLRKAKVVGDIHYEDYVRYVGLALADRRVDTNSIRKLPRHERFKGDPSEWDKTTRAQAAIPTLAEILELFI